MGQSLHPHSTADHVLESYEKPPPIVLPSEGFQVDLEADCPDGVYQHLIYIRHFLWGLRGPTSPDRGVIQPASLEVRVGWLGEGPGSQSYHVVLGRDRHRTAWAWRHY